MQITPGGYAVVGAAALAAGVTRSASTSVIVFELTGRLNHMLPVLVAVLIACGVGSAFNASIYDMMMALNKLPYIQPLKPHQASRRCAFDVMDSSLAALRTPVTHFDAHKCRPDVARWLLAGTKALEFPLVDADGALLGTVPRGYLALQIETLLSKLRRKPPALLD